MHFKILLESAFDLGSNQRISRLNISNEILKRVHFDSIQGVDINMFYHRDTERTFTKSVSMFFIKMENINLQKMKCLPLFCKSFYKSCK